MKHLVKLSCDNALLKLYKKGSISKSVFEKMLHNELAVMNMEEKSEEVSLMTLKDSQLESSLDCI